MPTPYSKPHLQVLLSLINEANPGLLELRDLENSRLGTMAVYTPKAGEIADTSLEIYPLPGSFYTGKRIVYYRRIQLNRFFANMVLTLDEWTANNRLPKTRYVELLSQKYGLLLTAEDLVAGHGDMVSGTLHNMQTSAESLLYSGTFQVRWTAGKRSLDQILPLSAYAGLYWDANYVQGKPLMNLVGMAIDFSRFAATKTLVTGSVISATSAEVRALAEWFGGYTGKTLDVMKPHTESGGLEGLSVTRFTLPNVNVPEANASRFNRALVIVPKTDSWFCGKIIWHYNE